MPGIIDRVKQFFIVKSFLGFDLQTGGLIIGAIDFFRSTQRLIHFSQAKTQAEINSCDGECVFFLILFLRFFKQ